MTVSIDTWLSDVATTLQVDLSVLDDQAILDLAGDAAHHVARPAAPLTTFLVGLAVGQRGGSQQTLLEVTEQVGAMARALPPLS